MHKDWNSGELPLLQHHNRYSLHETARNRVGLQERPSKNEREKPLHAT